MHVSRSGSTSDHYEIMLKEKDLQENSFIELGVPIITFHWRCRKKAFKLDPPNPEPAASPY